MANEPLLLSIDLGTTACKAFVVSSKCEVLGVSGHECPLVKRSANMIEQHAQDWWRVASVVAREAIANSGRSGRDVRAMSVSSQGISIVPVDGSGEVLRPVISWLDTRANEEIDHILESISPQELFQLTGKRPNVFYSLPKIMWIKKHEPDVFEKTSRFLLPHDYLIYRLTGRFVTDHSLASGTLAHDVTGLDWSPRMLEIAGIDPGMFCDLTWAGTPVGVILAESAETLGVCPEAVVTCGGQDQKCAALGVGAKKGTVTVSLRTASAISTIVQAPVLDSQMRLPCFPFLVPRTWVLEGVISTAGGAVKWLKEAFFSGGYGLLDECAESAFEGTRGLFLYPHLAGAGSPVWDSALPGVVWGIRLSTSPADLARSVLEGIAYQIRSNVETIGELGVEADRVKVFGGGAKSKVWLQIIADVLGTEVSVPASTEAAAMGACLLAGVGSGVYANAEEGASAFSAGGSVIEPDEGRAREYDERYARYREIEKRLAEA